MLDEIEKSFIECFVVKSKQDRLLFELGGKKRRDGVGRFCHNAEEILRPEKIMMSGDCLLIQNIMEVCRQYDISQECYIIAYDPRLDRRICSLNDALKLVLGNGMPAIIICNDLIIVETEQCFGTPTRYILRDKND